MSLGNRFIALFVAVSIFIVVVLFIEKDTINGKFNITLKSYCISQVVHQGRDLRLPTEEPGLITIDLNSDCPNSVNFSGRFVLLPCGESFSAYYKVIYKYASDSVYILPDNEACNLLQGGYEIKYGYDKSLVLVSTSTEIRLYQNSYGF